MELKTLQFNEALDSPYEYKWIINTKEHGEAFFKAANTKIEVYIRKHYGTGDIVLDNDPLNDDPVHEISFSEAGKHTPSKWYLTGKGDQFRVMATVLQIITDYVNKHLSDIEHIGFVANGTERGKVALYTRLFKKLTPKGKWKKDTYSMDGDKFFTMSKK